MESSVQEQVKWYLEMGPDGKFVAKYRKFPQIIPGASPSSSSSSSLKTSSKQNQTKKRSEINGKAMTTWWIKLTAFTALNGSLILSLFKPELEYLHPEESLTHQVIFTLRGLCACSGLCVGIG